MRYIVEMRAEEKGEGTSLFLVFTATFYQGLEVKVGVRPFASRSKERRPFPLYPKGTAKIVGSQLLDSSEWKLLFGRIAQEVRKYLRHREREEAQASFPGFAPPTLQEKARLVREREERSTKIYICSPR